MALAARGPPFPVNAARAGNLREVTRWRQHAGAAGGPPNPVDAPFPFDEWRPLQLAAAEGDRAAVETLLAAGADVNGRATSAFLPCATALHVAARYGHAAVARALVDAGADQARGPRANETPRKGILGRGRPREAAVL